MIRWYYYISRWAVILFFKTFTTCRVKDLGNVPVKGAVLLVSNHLSNADPPLISTTLKRNAIFMAKEELFRNRIIGYLVYGLGAFPVHRGKLDRKAIRHSEKILSENKILVMFPEATRSKGVQLQAAYPGSALIATRLNVPIVPVAITGTEKLAGWSWIYRRYPLLIRFGKPFNLPSSYDRNSRTDLSESTEYIMKHIAELLPEEYRGVYHIQERNHAPVN